VKLLFAITRALIVYPIASKKIPRRHAIFSIDRRAVVVERFD
jgi:hypothetical protein